MSTVIRVGTRGSALAMAQTKAIAARIGSAAKAEIEIVSVTTHGDTSRESLATIGGTGVFASALRESLLAGECDIIVHSLKDLPTAGYPGLRLAATPKRADARDTLCSRDGHTLDTLPEGARIGTGSPRRIAQLRKRRPDLEILDIRGNIDSRLARVSDELDADDPQRLDAILLAAAGLGRLGKLDHVSEYLDLSGWPTAPGQGALAIEVREDGVGEPLDRAVRAALETVNHGTTAATTLAERLVLAGLEAGCSAPVAAMAEVDSELLFLTATVYSLDGERSLTSSHAATPEGHGAEHLADAARDVASRVVEELLGNGAADLAVLKGKP